ncbi:pyridoxal phosphate-dependent aminotransferase [Candidatus Micrarchaeota archaeon]|nr:pyridoxal phosphate-dependent aminotransferase [Candidatus Micrarchaeota archaeon]MBU1682201.1 pyridoxal phosphate-dependent aminotransferase [Candidatus Micrarchaeota archaeon]
MGFYELAEKALKLEREGKKIIRLNVGDTNLQTPECATHAAIEEIKKRNSDYVSSSGMMELKEKIAEREGCEIENIIIGPGSKSMIYGLFKVLAEKGDKVTAPSPTWPAYGLLCKHLGLKLNNIKTKIEDNWEFGDLDLDESKITIICNPLNPTSTVYKEETIRRTIENSKGYVILDEAYKALAFDKVPTYEGAIRVRSFSKEFNMANWRLGYTVAPKEIIEKMLKFNQISITCVPPFVQKAGIACLENEADLIEQNMRVWKSRSKVATKTLEDSGFKFALPQAGIYVFATHKNIADADEFALKALDLGVAVAPGSSFGGHDKFFRICINQDEETLEEAIQILKKVK